MTENQRPLYQLYEPQLKHIVTIKLNIGGSENIKGSSSYYAVNVCFPKYSIEGKDGRDTSFKSALQLPRWNEVLSINVIKSEKEVSEYDVDFNLKSKSEYGEASVICSKRFKLGEIIGNRTVIFDLNDEQKLKVFLINIDFDFEPYVRIRDQFKLCEDEENFCINRRTKMMEKFRSLVKDKMQLLDVPNIAVIGSGGGMRAVVGMCGAMTKLKEHGILDYVIYLAGVSGSSWYISTLYAEDEKDICPERVKRKLKRNLQESQSDSEVMKTTLVNAFQSEIYTKNNTLTNVFGNVIGGILFGDTKIRKWSDQRTKLDAGDNPLPLLAALQVKVSTNLEKFHEWMEFSPYEAFLPTYGTGIDMKHFGSEFNGGCMTKKHDENPIHFLQGICGSAYGMVMRLINKENKEESLPWYSAHKLFSALLQTVQTIGLARVPNWLQGIDDPKQLFKEDDELSKCVKEVLNTKNQTMMLTDAGIQFNSPFPLVLHPAREVDLILSFEFSDKIGDEDWPFGELKKAEKWAKLRNIPFPEVNYEANTRSDTVQDVYVFEGQNCPTIMHFVLHENTRNLQLDQRDLFVKYNMFRFHLEEEEFTWLSTLMENIVSHNIDSIKKRITHALKTRLARRSGVSN